MLKRWQIVEKIVDLTLEANLDYNEFSDLADIPLEDAEDYFNGVGDLSIWHLHKIAGAFNMRLNQLIGEYTPQDLVHLEIKRGEYVLERGDDDDAIARAIDECRTELDEEMVQYGRKLVRLKQELYNTEDSKLHIELVDTRNMLDELDSIEQAYEVMDGILQFFYNGGGDTDIRFLFGGDD